MQFSLISTSLLCFTTWMNLVQTTIGSVAHCPCVIVSNNKVPHSKITNYAIQEEGPCLFTAVAFWTEAGNKICSTENKWTKRVIEELQKRQNNICPPQGCELTSTPKTLETTSTSAPGTEPQSTTASAPSTTANALGYNQQTTIASSPGSDTQSTNASTPATAPSNPTSLPGSEPTSTPILAPSTTASVTSTTPALAPSTSMTPTPVPEKSTPIPTSAQNNITGASDTRSASDRMPAITTRRRKASTRRHSTTRRRRNKRKIREWQKKCGKTSK